MALVKTMDMLAACERGKYAVGAFNLNSLDQAPFLIKRAEQLKAPLLLADGDGRPTEEYNRIYHREV